MGSEVQASRTAVLVCQGRAAADGRIAPDRFRDPVAGDLLTDAEREVVQQVRTGAAPRAWGERMQYEFVRSCAELMVPRTVAIDDAIRAAASPQVVILGAGLDTRAWRMTELAETPVYEVDHPASQRDKRARTAERAPVTPSLRFVAVDFARDDLAAGLAAAGHDAGVPTTWVWEGVVPYLTPTQVAATVAIIAARSVAGSRLVINYQIGAFSANLGRMAGRVMARLARIPDPWAQEPHRSAWTPAGIARLLADHGFAVTEDRDLYEIAELLGVQARQQTSLRHGRVLVATLD